MRFHLAAVLRDFVVLQCGITVASFSYLRVEVGGVWSCFLFLHHVTDGMKKSAMRIAFFWGL